MIETIQNSDGNPILRVVDDNGNPVEVAAQPTSAPAAQSEVAAAPAEPAAEAETSTPPREMTKEEAIVALCRAARGTDDPSLLRAICLGCKALAREGIHKRRNRASRSARGKEAV